MTTPHDTARRHRAAYRRVDRRDGPTVAVTTAPAVRRATRVAMVLFLTLAGLGAGCTVDRSSASSGAGPARSTVEEPSRRSAEPLPTIELDRPLDVGTLVDGDAQPILAPVIGVEATVSEEVDTVVMIGDSITMASTEALEAQFARLGFADPVIIAKVSKRIAQPVRGNPSGAELAAFLTADDGAADPGRANELWIIALGTNDIGNTDAEEVGAAVDEVLAHVPEESPLVWVDTFYRDEPDGETLVNDAITERIAARGNAVVAPWSFFAGSEGVLRSDGVHPSAAGTEVFAAVVAETADRFLNG